MISKLTFEQESQLSIYKDKWLKIGLSTDRIDIVEAKNIGSRLMKFLGRDKYISTIVMPCPVTAWFAVVMLSELEQQIENHKVQINDKTINNIIDKALNNNPDLKKSFIHPCLDGSLGWSGWCSFYDYMESCLDCELDDWSILKDITKCGFIWPLNNFVVISDKLSILHMQDGLLHNESGPSWSYTNGLCGYTISGVAVDEQIVMQPESQTLDQITKETNQEIKRIRIERYGWDKYLLEIGAEILDTQHHDWMESLMKTPDGMTVLCTYDPSTGRPYALEVDPSCSTCEEAQYFLNPSEVSLEGIDVKSNAVYPVVRT